MKRLTRAFVSNEVKRLLGEQWELVGGNGASYKLVQPNEGVTVTVYPEVASGRKVSHLDDVLRVAAATAEAMAATVDTTTTTTTTATVEEQQAEGGAADQEEAWIDVSKPLDRKQASVEVAILDDSVGGCLSRYVNVEKAKACRDLWLLCAHTLTHFPERFSFTKFYSSRSGTYCLAGFIWLQLHGTMNGVNDGNCWDFAADALGLSGFTASAALFSGHSTAASCLANVNKIGNWLFGDEWITFKASAKG